MSLVYVITVIQRVESDRLFYKDSIQVADKISMYVTLVKYPSMKTVARQ